MTDNGAKQWSAFIHLGAFLGYVFPFGHIIGPLVIWMLKKDSDSFVDENGKAAINFQISLTIYILLLFIFVFMAAFGLIMSGDGIAFIPFLIISVILFFVLEILFIARGASAAYAGKVYRYPLTIRFLR